MKLVTVSGGFMSCCGFCGTHHENGECRSIAAGQLTAERRGMSDVERLRELLYWLHRKPNNQYPYDECRYCGYTWWSGHDPETHMRDCIVPEARAAFFRLVGREQAGVNGVQDNDGPAERAQPPAVQPAPVSAPEPPEDALRWLAGQEQSPHYFGPDGSGAATGTKNLGREQAGGRPSEVTTSGEALHPEASPASCVPCPVRGSAQQFMDWAAEEIADGRLRTGFFLRFMDELVAVRFALAAPCLGPPAAPSEAGKVEPL